jgi:hypothetical protein
MKGGIYVGKETLLINSNFTFANSTIADALSENLTSGYLYVPHIDTLHPPHLQTVQTNQCQAILNIAHPTFLMKSSLCIRFQYEIYPYDYMFNDSDIATLVRKLFYNRKSKPIALPDKKSKVPNIGHYVWLGKNEMKLDFFLSIISALYVGKIDKVVIHCNHPPHGDYWDRLMRRCGQRVYTVYKPQHTSVFGNVVKTNCIC